MSFFVQWFYILALAIWVGSMVFFSFFTTPSLFLTLPKEMTGQVLSHLFSRYYLVGYVCGITLLLSSFLESLQMKQVPWVRVLLILTMLGTTFYADMIVRPKVHNLKVEMKALEEDSALGEELKSRFRKLHGLSMILNLMVLSGGLLLTGILAFRLRL